MGSGFNKTISSYGIIGFVRFLEGYYMILITSRLKAAMLGHHSVFKIADTAMVYIPNEEVRETHPGKHIFGPFGPFLAFLALFALFGPFWPFLFFMPWSTFQMKKFVKLIQVNIFLALFGIYLVYMWPFLVF
jgi:hypothetical protein